MTLLQNTQILLFSTIAMEWQHRIKQWLKRPSLLGLCGIEITAQGIAFARISYPAAQKPRLTHCEFLACSELQQIPTILGNFIEAQQLVDSNCSWVLSKQDYQLLTLDPLPIPAAELRTALPWRIKDQINFPIAEATIDYFELPQEPQPTPTGLLYVVITRTQHLQTRSQQLIASQLNIHSIDITELALRNLARLYPEQAAGVGILLLQAEQSALLIIKQDTLYLHRQINLALADLLSAATDQPLSEQALRLLDSLALEIQRSFDYYQRQLRQLSPSILLITQEQPQMHAYLSEQLNCQIELLTPNIDCAPGVEFRPECLLALGAALRAEVND